MTSYTVHQNETGSFQELAHASDVEFGQLSLLTIAPRCKRGGHYHTRKREWFCCIHGACVIVLADTAVGMQLDAIELSDVSREFVEVCPYEVHTVLNPHDQECELLAISSEEYDPENPDTIKYEVQR